MGKQVLYNFSFMGTDASQAPWFEGMNGDINAWGMARQPMPSLC